MSKVLRSQGGWSAGTFGEVEAGSTQEPPLQEELGAVRNPGLEPRSLPSSSSFGQSAPLVHASGRKKLRVLEATELRFDRAFGKGQDRQRHVRAASELVPFGGGFLVPQDDSTFAAFWRGDSVKPLRLLPPVKGADTFSEARGNKADKPDFEVGAAIMVDGQPAAVLFGSGSTSARMQMVLVRGDPDAPVIEAVAIPTLYHAAMKVLDLGPEQLNLEGAAVIDDSLRFFQRGNGAGSANVSFDVPIEALIEALRHGRELSEADLTSVRRYELGRLGGAALGFTAATALKEGWIVFAAAGEATASTYDDGARTGTMLGLLTPDGTIAQMAELPPGPDGPYKMEGLAIEAVKAGVAVIRLVEDADSYHTPSKALRVRWVLPKVCRQA